MLTTSTGVRGLLRQPHASDEWLTPPDLLAALGEFDLDPCAPVDRPWPTAKRHLTIESNGLRPGWVGRVFINPPYSVHTGLWVKRLATHGNGIALVFARTETGWFQDYVWHRANAILFIRGRLRFYTVAGERSTRDASAASVLVAYGQRNVEALEQSEIEGKLIYPAAFPPAPAKEAP